MRRERLRRYLEAEPATAAERLSDLLEAIEKKQPAYLLDLLDAIEDAHVTSKNVFLCCTSVRDALYKLVFAGDPDQQSSAIAHLLACGDVDVFDLIWDLGQHYGNKISSSAIHPLADAIFRETTPLDIALDGFRSGIARAERMNESGPLKLLRRIQRQAKLVGFETMIGTQLKSRYWAFLKEFSGNKLLLLGSSSTGKTYLAEMLHRNFRDGKFVKVDCANITKKEMAASIESAIDGTLLLDEVHSLATKGSIQKSMLVPIRDAQNKNKMLIVSATDKMRPDQVNGNPLKLDDALWNRIGLCQAFDVPSLCDRQTDLREWIQARASAKYIELDQPLLEKFAVCFTYPHNIEDVNALVEELSAKTRICLQSHRLDEAGINVIRPHLTGQALIIVNACIPQP